MLYKIIGKMFRFLVSPCRFSLVPLPYFFCIGGLILSVVLFYPVPMSTDPYTQCCQAKTGIIGDWHPPIMAASWRFVQHLYFVITGSDASCKDVMRFLYLSFIWFGLFFVLSSGKSFWQNTGTSQKTYWETGFVLLLLLWSGLDLVFISAHINKDTGLIGSYFAAVGLLLYFPKQKRMQWFAGLSVLFFLFYGTAIRHNAVFAAFPLLCWFVWLIVPLKKLSVIVPAGIILWFAMLAGIHYVNYGVIKAVRLYPLQEMFYLDILHLNAITPHYVPPPDTFDNVFSNLDEESFRKNFNSDVLVLRSALKELNEGNEGVPPRRKIRLDRSDIVPCFKEQEDKTIEIINGFSPLFAGQDFTVRPLDVLHIREHYPKDYVTLKDAWLKRIVRDPLPYLKFKTRYFYRLCRDNYIWFGRLNALTVLPVITFIGIGCLFSRRLLSPAVFPGLMLVWSALLYIAPLVIVMGATELRYLYWFFAASLISIVFFCSQSALFQETGLLIRRHLKHKAEEFSNPLH